ncbi:MAG: NAD(P)H-binding protein [Dehalococcoidia bacterium]|nr:NAD(P)H-binding protein [Dehalococcoidia bacterium]MYA02262.1 NAD(P)H-binding protein [Chloroflexota bacterium]
MRVTVTGATGYTGRHITTLLLGAGHQVQSITGHPDRPNPFGAQVPLHSFNFDNPDQLAAVLAGSDALINTYWVRFPHGGRTYDQAVDNTLTLFDAARRAGVGRVVHISIAQADRSPLPYFQGKAALEASLRASGLSHAIIRPTVIYGGGRDVLLSNVAWCLRRFPVFVLPPGGCSIQPVHVDDLAELAVAEAANTQNTLVDAAGHETYRFRDLVTLIRDTLGLRCLVLPAPRPLVYAAGRIIGLFVKDVVLTRDEIEGLSAGLCVSGDPPVTTTPTKLSEWLTDHKDTLGRVYASELQRHYR